MCSFCSVECVLSSVLALHHSSQPFNLVHLVNTVDRAISSIMVDTVVHLAKKFSSRGFFELRLSLMRHLVHFMLHLVQFSFTFLFVTKAEKMN